jgi:hypothetical protein
MRNQTSESCGNQAENAEDAGHDDETFRRLCLVRHHGTYVPCYDARNDRAHARDYLSRVRHAHGKVGLRNGQAEVPVESWHKMGAAVGKHRLDEWELVDKAGHNHYHVEGCSRCAGRSPFGLGGRSADQTCDHLGHHDNRLVHPGPNRTNMAEHGRSGPTVESEGDTGYALGRTEARRTEDAGKAPGTAAGSPARAGDGSLGVRSWEDSWQAAEEVHPEEHSPDGGLANTHSMGGSRREQCWEGCNPGADSRGIHSHSDQSPGDRRDLCHHVEV